jgi:hypothetical protein
VHDIIAANLGRSATRLSSSAASAVPLSLASAAHAH